jgi:hypothetical protein
MFDSLAEAQRRHAVAYVVALTANSALAPQPYERQLRDRFAHGELTLDQLEYLLATRVHQVLYHSQVTQLPTEEDLQGLRELSRRYNTAHGITGLLLYSEARYVQLLEGPQAAVEDLYRRIQHDIRHTRVHTVRQGPGPRRFQFWTMAVGHVTPPHLAETVIASQSTIPAPLISDPRLQALLQAFV